MAEYPNADEIRELLGQDGIDALIKDAPDYVLFDNVAWFDMSDLTDAHNLPALLSYFAEFTNAAREVGLVVTADHGRIDVRVTRSQEKREASVIDSERYRVHRERSDAEKAAATATDTDTGNA